MRILPYFSFSTLTALALLVACGSSNDSSAPGNSTGADASPASDANGPADEQDGGADASVIGPTTWGQPVEIQPDLSSPTFRVFPLETRVAIDDNGNALAIWTATEVESGSPAYSVHSSHYVPGTGWSTHVRVDSGPKSFTLDDPHFAFDASGNGLAVWSKLGGVAETAVYDATSGWQASMPLTPNNGTTGNLALAMTPDGHAFLAYRSLQGTSQAIYASRFVPGTGWEAPQFIKVLTFGSVFNVPGGQPAVAVGVNGDAVVTWRDPDGAAYAARYAGGWQAPESLGPTFALVYDVPKGQPLYDYSPCASIVDATGNMTVVWQNEDGYGSSKLIATNHAPSGAWSTPVDLDPADDASRSTNPIIGLDGAGNAKLVWRTEAAGTRAMTANFSTRAAGADSWQPAAAITPVQGLGRLSFAISKNGSAVLVYPPAKMQLSARSFLPQSGWSEPTHINLPTGRSSVVSGTGNQLDERDFDVAVDPQGRAAVAWTHELPEVPAYLSTNTMWANSTY